jgi:hypothetical protein
VPVNTDSVIIINNDVNICWGLDQSAVTLVDLYVYQSYTGRIGLDRTAFATSADGETGTNTSKPEYREDYLKIQYANGAFGLPDGVGSPTGSQRIKIHNTETTASLTYVYNTASTSADTGLPAWRGVFDDADADVYIGTGCSGGWGIGVDPDRTSVIVGKILVAGSGSTRGTIGGGVSATSFEQDNGTAQIQGGGGTAMTTLTMNGGTLETIDDWEVTTAHMNGGTWYATHHWAVRSRQISR